MQSLGELIDWCEEHRRRGRDTAHESVELAFDERLWLATQSERAPVRDVGNG